MSPLQSRFLYHQAWKELYQRMKRFRRAMYKVNRNLYRPYSSGFIHHHIPQLFSRPSASCSSDFQMPFIALQFKVDFFWCENQSTLEHSFHAHYTNKSLSKWPYLLLVTDDASSISRLTWALYLLNRCPQPLLCSLSPTFYQWMTLFSIQVIQ